MILKGNQRAGGSRLAAHLLNRRDNDHIDVHELRGLASESLTAALLEIETAAKPTRAKQPFFHVSFSPPAKADLTIAQYEHAFAALEAKFGLENQPRAVVFHEKDGRRHAHAVWSRITEDGRAIQLSHSRMKMRDISRQLFAEFGLVAPRGLRDRRERDPTTYDRPLWQQAKRLEEDPRDLKAIIRQALERSDSAASFQQALSVHAMTLARGDRRGFVIVHHSGDVLSLSRYAGMTTREIKSRLGDPARFPSVDQIKDRIAPRMEAAGKDLIQKVKARHTQEQTPVIQQLVSLRDRHRAERDALLKRQQERRAKESLERAERLRGGLMGFFDRISGKRTRIARENAKAIEAARTRDFHEKQALIDLQLTQRRSLQKDIVQLRDRQKQEKAESRRELGFYLGLSPARVRDMAEADIKAREPLSWAFDEHGNRVNNIVPFPGQDKPLESFNEQAKGTGPEPEPPSPGPSKGRGRERTPEDEPKPD